MSSIESSLGPLTKKNSRRKRTPYQKKRVKQSHKYRTHTKQWFIKLSKSGRPLVRRKSSDSE